MTMEAVLCGLFAVSKVALAVSRSRTPPRDGSPVTSPSFGIGVHGLVSMLSSLGLAFSLPRLALWLIFRFGAPSDDGQALEFACQIERSEMGTYPLFPLFFAAIIVLSLTTNAMRNWTRFSVVDLARSHLKPASSGAEGGSADEGAAGDTPRLVILPAFRGAWVAPFTVLFAAACSSRPEVLAYDAYGHHALCPEDDGWIRANVPADLATVAHREAKHGHRAESSFAASSVDFRVGYTDFKAPLGLPHSTSSSSSGSHSHTLALPHGSVDVIVVPVGASTQAFRSDGGGSGNGSGSSSTPPAEVMASALRHYRGLLRPGGRLIAANIVTSEGAWLKALTAAGFAKGEVTTLSTWVWITWLPARVTIAVKAGEGSGEEEEEASEEEGGESSPVDGAPARPFSPPASLRLLSFALLSLALAAWAGLVYATYSNLSALAVPSFLPYGVTVGSMLIGHVTILPLLLLYLYNEMTTAAATPVPAYAPVVSTSAASFEDAATAPLLKAEAAHTDTHVVAATPGHLLRIYANRVLRILAGLTVYTALQWLPIFLLDTLLIKKTSVSVSTVGTINTIVNITVLFGAAQLSRRLVARKEAAAAAAAAERARTRELAKMTAAASKASEATATA